ncbi:unnamed protein product [Tuber aestivum]|uniref:Uncharacterized protein n=1 Tax=Tuber aestivum TaxID=59557 RepID=A0A292PYY8_9PEZI|nr:unnamed protein product [Tuber aestivum]
MSEKVCVLDQDSGMEQQPCQIIQTAHYFSRRYKSFLDNCFRISLWGYCKLLSQCVFIIRIIRTRGLAKRFEGLGVPQRLDAVTFSYTPAQPSTIYRWYEIRAAPDQSR